ncbi:hypothetical protein CD351_03570 [Erythrobacter sp. KY5]|nr:hypothetical protein CD351_03570 [Erythrobacter sp. KY5]
MLDWWLLWRVPVLALIVMAIWWFAFRPMLHERGWVEVDEHFVICGSGESAPGCVVDGDTVVIGFGAERRRIRLIGFDAPELDGQCASESQFALTARDRLFEWLAQGPFEWNGDASPPRDQYGRELRSARRILPDGSREYLAQTMIAGGLASESGWGSSPQDWCE